MGMPLEHQEVKGQTLGRATWYQRHGMPTIIPHLGVPLESQAWHANAQPLTGHATWYRRRGTQNIIPHLGVPLESQVWHANAQPLTGRATWCRRRGMPASLLNKKKTGCAT
ncbi:hypothetical protein AHAS_Ahas14G0139400 [Arachis hypogaea]